MNGKEMKKIKSIFRWKNLDIPIIIIIATFYWIKWQGVESHELIEASAKTLSLTAINNAIYTGIIAVSILLPLLFGIVFLREKTEDSSQEVIKEYFLKPSNVSFTSIGLFNEFTHRLTSPLVMVSQYFSFVKTCFGSLHPFRLGISVV